MRVAVYLDQAYRRDGSGIHSPRSFSLFLDRLAGRCERLRLLGRLDPLPGRASHRLGPATEFVPLPFYASGSDPRGVARATVVSARRFWRVLADSDVVLLFGPHGLCVPFALLALARGREVVLGVRQDLPAYVRGRHPGARAALAAATLLDGLWRLLARRLRVVVVGPALARRYRRAPRLLELYVSLVETGDVAGLDALAARDYGGDLEVLSVGRLDAEKNPLLLADVLAELRRADPRWRLTVCGDGDLRAPLAARLRALGVADAADLRGDVPLDGGLLDLYRRSHLLLHTSLTEGAPQVLGEAFAAALPVVATDVGGVAELAPGAIAPIPPGDARAAAAALRRLARDSAEREALVSAGHRWVLRHTAEAEIDRLAAFLRAS